MTRFTEKDRKLMKDVFDVVCDSCADVDECSDLYKAEDIKDDLREVCGSLRAASMVAVVLGIMADPAKQEQLNVIAREYIGA